MLVLIESLTLDTLRRTEKRRPLANKDKMWA